MCEQCKELDAKIRRYRSFIARGLDALTVERINGLIQELQQRKEALRCSASSGSKD
jgi:flagellar hook-associated protein FlgK